MGGGKVPGKEDLPQRTDGVFVIQQGLCYCTWDTPETKELIDHMGEVKATGAAGGFRVQFPGSGLKPNLGGLGTWEWTSPENLGLRGG